jgi:hypothetical protein
LEDDTTQTQEYMENDMRWNREEKRQEGRQRKREYDEQIKGQERKMDQRFTKKRVLRQQEDYDSIHSPISYLETIHHISFFIKMKQIARDPLF